MDISLDTVSHKGRSATDHVLLLLANHVLPVLFLLYNHVLDVFFLNVDQLLTALSLLACHLIEVLFYSRDLFIKKSMVDGTS